MVSQSPCRTGRLGTRTEVAWSGATRVLSPPIEFSALASLGGASSRLGRNQRLVRDAQRVTEISLGSNRHASLTEALQNRMPRHLPCRLRLLELLAPPRIE